MFAKVNHFILAVAAHLALAAASCAQSANLIQSPQAKVINILRNVNPGPNGVRIASAVNINNEVGLVFYDKEAKNLKCAIIDQHDKVDVSVVSESLSKGSFCSIAANSKGRFGVAYFDSMRFELWYASHDGTWSSSKVGVPFGGSYCSLVYGNDDVPYIAFSSLPKRGLNVAYFRDSKWDSISIDGYSFASDVSLSKSKYGSLGVSYTDETQGDLKYYLSKIGKSTIGIPSRIVESGVGSKLLNVDSPAVVYKVAILQHLKVAMRDETTNWIVENLTTNGPVEYFDAVWVDGNPLVVAAVNTSWGKVVLNLFQKHGSNWNLVDLSQLGNVKSFCAIQVVNNFAYIAYQTVEGIFVVKLPIK